MSGEVKLALAGAGAVVGLLLLRRRRRAPEGRAGLCVSGATGSDACGGDFDPRPWWHPGRLLDLFPSGAAPPSWSAEPVGTVTKTDEWTGDPVR